MSKMKKDMTRRTFFIADPIMKRVIDLSTRQGTTTSDLVRRALIELLERMEQKSPTP